MNSYSDSWNDNVLQGTRAEAETSFGFTTLLKSMTHHRFWVADGTQMSGSLELTSPDLSPLVLLPGRTTIPVPCFTWMA